MVFDTNFKNKLKVSIIHLPLGIETNKQNNVSRTEPIGQRRKGSLSLSFLILVLVFSKEGAWW